MKLAQRMTAVASAAVLLSGALAVVSCKSSVGPNVAATVNGRPITYSDIDKAMAAQGLNAGKNPKDDQGVGLRLETLRTLVDNEIVFQRSEKAGLTAVDADVESKINELKAPYTQEEFQKQLSAKKMTIDDLKTQVRRELSIQKLFAKEIGSHISISDVDVANFYNTNKAQFNFPEARIHLSQILVTPSPDPNVRNLKSDKAQTDDQAKNKIAMIEARLKQGEDFGQLAQAYSEDSNSAPNGGDMGFVPQSALDRANPELRKLILDLPSGQITRVLHTPEGYRILKVISKEPAGQRELNDPRVQQSIRETLINGKDQLLRAAFYETARNEAKVVNYYAESILQNRDKR